MHSMLKPHHMYRSDGLVSVSKSSHEWNEAVLRALMRDTQSLINFLVYFLKVSVISGNGGSHFKVFPRSPWVPIAQR